MKSCKVFCLVHADISHPQEKFLDATGYNGRIKVQCYYNPEIELILTTTKMPWTQLRTVNSNVFMK